MSERPVAVAAMEQLSAAVTYRGESPHFRGAERTMSAEVSKAASEKSGDVLDSVDRTLAEVEREHILAVLEKYHWNRTRSAKVLGIDVKTLYNKLKSYRAKDPSRDRD